MDTSHRKRHSLSRSPTESVRIISDNVLRRSQQSLWIRAVVLFVVGVLFALVLNLLQVQRRVTLFPPEVLASLFSSAWWIPPCCGVASGTVHV